MGGCDPSRGPDPAIASCQGPKHRPRSWLAVLFRVMLTLRGYQPGLLFGPSGFSGLLLRCGLLGGRSHGTTSWAGVGCNICDGSGFVSGKRSTGRPPIGALKQYKVPTANSQPRAVTNGSDGNRWFTEGTEFTGAPAKIARITPAGAVTEFVPDVAGWLQWLHHYRHRPGARRHSVHHLQ
jgi:hypothetical protein